MTLVYACIAPHGGEIVPELAGESRSVFNETRRGMRSLAREMKAAAPDTIIIATPHNLRISGHMGVVLAENTSGSLADNGREISLKAVCDVGLAQKILVGAARRGVPAVGANYGTSTGPMSSLQMDWGTLIPLWFLLKLNRLRSKVVILTPARDLPLKLHRRFGREVGALAEAERKRIAFVASADQAHAHAKEGPYGYSPQASAYDARVAEAVSKDRLSDILKFGPSLVEGAKPDSLWQMSILSGVLDKVRMKPRLHSYQVPTYYGMLCAGYTRFKG